MGREEINQEKRERVLIAMSGREDSTVAAYLLKKQGFDCIGIYFQFIDTGESNDASCTTSSLELAQSVCEQLSIPFYAVRAKQQYKAIVLDPLLSSTLAGKHFPTCIWCNYLKVDLLLEKAELLKVDYIATGHYARVQKNHTVGEYTLVTANDLEADQSFLLSRLNKVHLEKLILPLADVRKGEVTKIAQSLGYTLAPSQPPAKGYCLSSGKILTALIEQNAARSLYPDGDILRLKDDVKVATHTGAHRYSLGQSNLPVNKNESIDPKLSVLQLDVARGQIYVGTLDDYEYDYLAIRQIHAELKLDQSKPILTYAMIGNKNTKFEVKLFLKNNKTGLIQFSEPQKGIPLIGQEVVCYNKPGVGGKIILSGTIASGGTFQAYERVQESEEDSKKSSKYDAKF